MDDEKHFIKWENYQRECFQGISNEINPLWKTWICIEFPTPAHFFLLLWNFWHEHLQVATWRMKFIRYHDERSFRHLWRQKYLCKIQFNGTSTVDGIINPSHFFFVFLAMRKKKSRDEFGTWNIFSLLRDKTTEGRFDLRVSVIFSDGKFVMRSLFCQCLNCWNSMRSFNEFLLKTLSIWSSLKTLDKNISHLSNFFDFFQKFLLSFLYIKKNCWNIF